MNSRRGEIFFSVLIRDMDSAEDQPVTKLLPSAHLDSSLKAREARNPHKPLRLSALELMLCPFLFI